MEPLKQYQKMVDDLSETRTQLKKNYWELHSKLGKQEYKNSGDQLKDQLLLGKIAIAMEQAGNLATALGDLNFQIFTISIK